MGGERGGLNRAFTVILLEIKLKVPVKKIYIFLISNLHVQKWSTRKANIPVQKKKKLDCILSNWNQITLFGSLEVYREQKK